MKNTIYKMKKELFIVTLFLIISSSFGQNLIKNGDFKTNLESWRNYASEDSNATFTLDNSNSNNLKVEVQQLGANSWDIQSLQNFTSQQGKKYVLKFRAKANTNNSKIRVQVQKTTYTSTDISLTTEWKNYTWNFKAKEDDLELAFQYFEKGIFNIDDVEITEFIDKDGGNLVYNGSLEKGMEGWINIIDNGANAVYTINKDTPFEGKNSLRVLVLRLGENTWDISSINNFPSKRGTKYKLTFMAKGNTSGKKLKAQVQHNDRRIYIPKDFVLTDKWEKYTWVFRARIDDMQIAFQYLSSGLYEIDNLSILPMTKKKKK